jgi:deoxyribonuclease-1
VLRSRLARRPRVCSKTNILQADRDIIYEFSVPPAAGPVWYNPARATAPACLLTDTGMYCFKQVLICLALLAAVPSVAVCDEDTRTDYDYVIDNFFWGDLYAGGGWSLYCGYKFDRNRRTVHGRVVEVGHIYATEWVLEQVGCDSRLQCYESGNRRFLEIESDLHNMYPVWYELVLLRKALPFGEIGGEEWRFDDCDFEWQADRAEPREIARGNIARALFYMHDTYGLRLEAGMLATLKEWHRRDPPSKQEIYRNDRIEALQGRRNPYIDNPALADALLAGRGG